MSLMACDGKSVLLKEIPHPGTPGLQITLLSCYKNPENKRGFLVTIPRDSEWLALSGRHRGNEAGRFGQLFFSVDALRQNAPPHSLPILSDWLSSRMRRSGACEGSLKWGISLKQAVSKRFLRFETILILRWMVEMMDCPSNSVIWKILHRRHVFCAVSATKW